MNNSKALRLYKYYISGIYDFMNLRLIKKTLTGSQEVDGSIPLCSTQKIKEIQFCKFFFNNNYTPEGYYICCFWFADYLNIRLGEK